MKFLIDENLSSPRLASRLRAQGHDPVLASDVGLLSVTDARVLIFAIAQALPVLTRDSEDFEDLHDLVMAAVGHHAGILIVRFDNDPRHNLTDRGIATAMCKLESSGVPIRDRIHVLNQWRRVLRLRFQEDRARLLLCSPRRRAEPSHTRFGSSRPECVFCYGKRTNFDA
jgi:predicted nuclease of predicted toxin-antitoxin system